MLHFLPYINATFAREQYGIFRDSFFTTFLGAPCVLEYPSGMSGSGDIDSGPLIFGRSLSATVLMMNAAQTYGDMDFANAIGQAGETAGLPWTSAEQKHDMPAYFQLATPWLPMPT